MRKNSRDDFLQSVRTIVEYWSKVAKTPEKSAQGTAFSIMCLLDGVSDNPYGYNVVDNLTGQRITVGGKELHDDLYN